MDHNLVLHYLKKDAIHYAFTIKEFIERDKYTNNLLAVAWLTEKMKKKHLPIFLELNAECNFFSKNLNNFLKNDEDFKNFIQEKCVTKVFDINTNIDRIEKEKLSGEVKEVISLNESNHNNSGFVINVIISHGKLGMVYSMIDHIRIDTDGPLIHYISPPGLLKTKQDRADFIEKIKNEIGERHFKKLWKQFAKKFKEYRNDNKGSKFLTLVEEDYGEKLKKGHFVSINLLESVERQTEKVVIQESRDK